MSSPTRLVNLGIVAHVDAGKTSLTERLLFEAGAIDAPGRVDHGTTRTDSLDLERRRGITIRAAVASFALPDLDVTLIDTPGHPDFIAEVERSLAVLDAAVLVVSAVEGVQPQTVVIWRALRRLEVPTLIFVNKVDRSGADVARVIAQIRPRLTDAVVPLTRTYDSGTAAASVTAVPLTDESIVEAMAEVDDVVLGAYVDGRDIRTSHLARTLRREVARCRVVPVLTGSAVTGAGLDTLQDAIARILPRMTDAGGEASATIFAIDRDAKGRRMWIRLWSGRFRVRDRVSVAGRERQRITGLAASTPAGLRPTDRVTAGQVAVVRGLDGQIGDTLGSPPHRPTPDFPPATAHALVEPVDPSRRVAMFAGLTELAEEDPLIGLHLDPADRQAAVQLRGEVQQEVIAALLQDRYDVAARFSVATPICIERVLGRGAAVDRIAAGDNPYLASIGLRVEPAAIGHGAHFSPGIERGNLPRAFIEATEEGVRVGLEQGLRGWEVTDCVITMTESGYYPRQSRPHQKFDKSISSVAADFRRLAPVVLHAALTAAGTQVCHPVEAFDLDLPDAAIGSVTSWLGRHGGLVLRSESAGAYARLAGHLPLGAVPTVAAALPDLTGGEGVLVTRHDHYSPAPAPVPTRRRRGPDPSDREEWFRDMPR